MLRSRPRGLNASKQEMRTAQWVSVGYVDPAGPILRTSHQLWTIITAWSMVIDSANACEVNFVSFWTIYYRSGGCNSATLHCAV